MNPINQDLDFYINFILHSIGSKNFDILIIGLNYIKDIRMFVSVIEKIKQNIFETFINPDTENKRNEKYIVELDKNLKFIEAENIEENKSKKYEDNKNHPKMKIK